LSNLRRKNERILYVVRFKPERSKNQGCRGK
jgi:hypothetical protein